MSVADDDGMHDVRFDRIMKILNVNMSIDPITGGGTAERTVKIARYLARHGVDSSLLTSDIGLDEKLCRSLSDVSLHVLRNFYTRYYISRISFKRIATIVAQADVVHLMNHWTAINAAVYRVCRQLNKPYVVCPAGALLYYGRSLLLKRMYNYIVGKNIIKNATRHVAIPAEEAYQFESYGIDPKSVVVIPNGIDQDDFNARDDHRFREKHALGSDPFILFMGRLNSIKGPDLLLNAFAACHKMSSRYRLVFAGPDDGMQKILETTAKKRAIENRVHFIGYVGGEEKSQAYHAAEILAVPSRQEAMSIVAIEAGITGTPVLMTDVCGFRHIEAINGGMIVKPEVTAIGDGLQTLLEDREESKQRGQRLKGYVLSNFTWDSIIAKYISVFRTISASSN